MTAFTPEQLAGVFVSRWAARDAANRFIRELHKDCVSILRNMRPLGPIDPRLAGRPIRIRVPSRGGAR